MKFRSLSFRLTRILIAICSAVFVAALFAIYLMCGKIIFEETVSSVKNELHADAAAIDKVFAETDCYLRSAVSVSRLNLDNEKELFAITRGVVEKSEYIIGSTIAFAPNQKKGEKWYAPYTYRDLATGEYCYKFLGGEGADYYTMDWYCGAADAGKPYWSEPYYDEFGCKQNMVTYSLPITDSAGKVVAVITADITLDWLSDIITNMQHDKSVITISSLKGEYVAATVEGLVGMNVADLVSQSEVSNVDKLSKVGTDNNDDVISFSINGVYSYAIVESLVNGWVVSHIGNYKDISDRTRTMGVIILVVCLCSLVATFFVARRVIRSLVKPIEELSVSAEKMGHGQFDVVLPEIDSRDELLRLRDTFAAVRNFLMYYIDEIKKTSSQKERMESEMRVGRVIQMGMLNTDFPVSSAVDLAAFIEPSKEVGGDFYDYLLEDDKLYFAIGDVSGKGVPAALMMAIGRSAAHFFFENKSDMDYAVSNINNIICDNNAEQMFITFFCGCLDISTGELCYCNAGHNPIVVQQPGGEAFYLKANANLVLGIFEQYNYVAESVVLQTGARLMLYTDGVSEAERSDKQQYGEDRLLQWCNANLATGTAAERVDRLYGDVKLFTNNIEPNDDITIMSIGYNGRQ